MHTEKAAERHMDILDAAIDSPRDYWQDDNLDDETVKDAYASAAVFSSDMSTVNESDDSRDEMYEVVGVRVAFQVRTFSLINSWFLSQRRGQTTAIAKSSLRFEVSAFEKKYFPKHGARFMLKS